MKSNNGFTLLEVIITVAVMAVALTAVSGILVSVVKVQQKQQAKLKIESGGNHVISLVEQVVRTNSNVSVSEDGSKLIYYDKNGNPKYIGRATISDAGCANGLGYVYNSNVDYPGDEIPDSDVVTDNDADNGVDVKELSFVESGTNPLWITATITIENTPCSNLFGSENLGTTFTTTVRSLR